MPAEHQGGWIRSLRRGVLAMVRALPIILSVVLLLGLFRTYVSRAQLRALVSGHGALDVLVGTAVGSIASGNAVTSYIIGGELLAQGVGLGEVTAFIVAWVTVGIVQLPAEAAMLGRRFALLRNLTSALLAVVVAIATVWTVSALP